MVTESEDKKFFSITIFTLIAIILKYMVPNFSKNATKLNIRESIRIRPINSIRSINHQLEFISINLKISRWPRSPKICPDSKYWLKIMLFAMQLVANSSGVSRKRFLGTTTWKEAGSKSHKINLLKLQMWDGKRVSHSAPMTRELQKNA